MDYVSIVDLGSQYAHLIHKRLSYLNIDSILTTEFDENVYRAKAVIVSGSPMSALKDNVKDIEINIRNIVNSGKPFLGICFGHQMLSIAYGGKMVSDRAEYGRTKINIVSKNSILEGLDNNEEVWMSHSDCVIDPGNGITNAISERGCISAIEIPNKIAYGVQFHPEVTHTRKGLQIFKNFLEIAGFKYKEISIYEKVSNYYAYILDEIKSNYHGGKIISAVSGGIDSTVSTYIVMKAVGYKNIIPVLIDHGLFRENEVDEVISYLRKVGIDPIYINAKQDFISKLEGILSCEEKRKIIGELFAQKLFDIIKQENADYLIQGTAYPDVIESGKTKHSQKIKSHHNVGGLPEWFNIKIIEPLRGLYKDEIRELGKIIGLPEEILKRQPFPGPGLAVRIIGNFSREKLEAVRKADKILADILKREGIYSHLWQSIATISDSWVGVKGDEREEGYIINIRLILSEDGMTADYYLPQKNLLDEISNRITNEVKNVSAVGFITSTKPPATIEPC
ncbi:MAG: glutamine-hydrolyzing GMP synthase [Caldisphaera sp.]|jgi:GMP synthase (glutamine-hydrolysing)|nr:glutamine-hydrolyzing GMP synthase [Caldisphaera sp.]PMP60590.1 MAG: glutamine-hydrolyzing GMP synthase [Caldisphaera sp.]PMP89784.1 MAG: glutamine-hydrolyzing GMP synthase [Caldisphaera sp.]